MVNIALDTSLRFLKVLLHGRARFKTFLLLQTFQTLPRNYLTIKCSHGESVTPI